jgi:tetratricopeptide (TPR) repeat protein
MTWTAHRRHFLLFALSLAQWVGITSAHAVTPAQSAPTTGASHSISSLPAPGHLLKGKQYGQAGNWIAAERELRIYRNAHPDSEEANVLLAESLIQLSQPFDAALELQLFLKQHPNSVRALRLHAALASKTLLDESLAQSELSKATELAPKDVRTWKALAELYMDEGKMESAIPALTEAHKLAPGDPVILASLAYATGQTTESGDVNAMFGKAIKLSEDSTKNMALVQMLYGRHLVEVGDAEQSIASFSKVLEMNPRYAPGLYWRARAYEQLKNLPAAEADAVLATKLDPGDNGAPLLLVTIYRKQGNLEKAQEYADLVQQIARNREAQNANGRELRESLDRGERLLDKGQFVEAIPEYQSVIQRLPNFYEAYFALGMCYGQTGHFSEAEVAFKKYLALQPISADGRAALGVLLLSMGRGTEAVPELQQAIQIDPTLLEARKALANEYLQQSNFKAAIETLRPVSNSSDFETQLSIAEAYRQSHEYVLALKAVNRAMAITPNQAQAIHLKQEIVEQEKNPK